MSISTATNWAFNWIVGEVTPYLQDAIEWRLYPMHAFFCILSFILGLFYIWINDLCLSFCLFVYSLLLWVLVTFSVRFVINFAVVYPETKGVPLEEMDAVFGEGVSLNYRFVMTCMLILNTSDERQEHLDNESEITSLVQTPSFDSEYLRNTLRQTNNNTDSWFDRLFKRSRRGDYEEIGGD